jgi:tRNA nucleotidyltransferase (CCA-adding enzyme)
MELQIPPQVAAVLDALEQGGFEACLVGGCVRDSLLGKAPEDWDVATSARPEDAERALCGFRVLETGLKHGTVTALSGGLPVEVTAYRIDGRYSDGRHPDRVAFTGSLQEDLARRDFTVNALAYSRKEGLVDCFGGRNDLERKRIRCVGQPDRRFQEDGLRILRALRFSSVLGFSIERGTARSLVRNRALLDRIARERIQSEFTKMICGKNAAQVMREFREVVAQFVPEIRPCFGFDQHNPHHRYDVWEHTLHCVESAPPEPVLRLTMFLHDIGKPGCFTRDAKGIGHFYGHASQSAELAQTILKRLRYDKKTVRTVVELIRCHDLPLPPDERFLRRRLNRLGEEKLRLLFQVAAADTMGKNQADRSRLETLKNAERLLDMILTQEQCFSLSSLAVGGKDLLLEGIPEGPAVGDMLQTLLSAVIDGKCSNSRTELLQYVRQLKGGHP